MKNLYQYLYSLGIIIDKRRLYTEYGYDWKKLYSVFRDMRTDRKTDVLNHALCPRR